MNGLGQLSPDASTPCEEGACEPRDVSAIAPFTPPSGVVAGEPVDIATVEDVLKDGLGQAGLSPVHLAFRGTAIHAPIFKSGRVGPGDLQ